MITEYSIIDSAMNKFKYRRSTYAAFWKSRPLFYPSLFARETSPVLRKFWQNGGRRVKKVWKLVRTRADSRPINST